MDRQKLEEIWSRFLAGEAVAPEEEAEVADALDADPRLLAELSRDHQLDRSLRGLGRADRDGEAFLESFSYRLRSEHDGTRFIATVKQKMKRSRRPPTRRWQAPVWTGPRVGIAAAVLLAFLGLLFAATTGGTGRKPDSAAAAPRRAADLIERPEPRVERPEAPLPAPAPPPIEPGPQRPLEPTPSPGKKEEAAPLPPPPVIVDPEPSKPDPGRKTVTPPARVLAVTGTVTRMTGEVSTVEGDVRTPVKPGQKLFAEQSIESVGARSSAQIQFADGTRVDLGADTTLSDLADSDAAKSRGKRIVLARGVLSADVAKQPAELPMIVATPHGEARVLGTVFRLSVEPGPAGSMRLDVKEGRVRLTRASDQKFVEVPAGGFATAGAVGDLELNSEHKVTVSFQDGVSPTPRYSGAADTFVLEAPKNAEKNFGGANVLWVDGDTTTGDDRYILMRWDLTALPPRCTVLSASIDIQVTNDSKGNPFELYELKRDWTEKEATWKSSASKLPWQVAGAQGVQDRGAAVLGILAPQKAGPYAIRLSPDGVAALQSWIDLPASNRGFVVANTDNQDAVAFHSREATLPANRPRLNITFIPRSGKDAAPK